MCARVVGGQYFLSLPRHRTPCTRTHIIPCSMASPPRAMLNTQSNVLHTDLFYILSCSETTSWECMLHWIHLLHRFSVDRVYIRFTCNLCIEVMLPILLYIIRERGFAHEHLTAQFQYQSNAICRILAVVNVIPYYRLVLFWFNQLYRVCQRF